MIKPDGITFLSSLPQYINVGTPTGNIVISGTVPDGTTQNFSVTIPTSTSNTRCDIYGENLNTLKKQLFSTSNYIAIYQFAGLEFTQLATSQASGSVTVTISVNNFTGGPITLTNQTITVSVVEYQIPY